MYRSENIFRSPMLILVSGFQEMGMIRLVATRNVIKEGKILVKRYVLSRQVKINRRENMDKLVWTGSIKATEVIAKKISLYLSGMNKI